MGDGNASLVALDIGAIAKSIGRHKSSAERRALRERWPFTETQCLGGKRRLYTLATLPTDVQAALLLANGEATRTADRPPSAHRDQEQIRAMWQRYETVPQHVKNVATLRLQALLAVEALVHAGHRLLDARGAIAAKLQREGVRGGSAASLGRWAQAVAGLDRHHWKAALVPDFVGRTVRQELPEEAWDQFKADYLRLEAPSATSCYDRLCRTAKVRGWTLPSLRTFERRIADLSPGMVILCREGEEALKRRYPAQERDRTAFTALEWVNADGHKFDVFVRTQMGQVVRPILVGVQDLYSNKLLGWRMAETESADLARLAFRDAIERYGVPHNALLDNGRGFAGKMLTGGVANRFRFKVREEDPTGVLVGLGINIHWALPYSGQSKPIERAWRDLCDRIAKHPEFAGAYTGNKPDAKPENYGSKAIAWDVFVRVVDAEIAAHNARLNRKTRVCAGVHSFDQAFNASYAQTTIRKATPEQLREMLLAAEVVTAGQDGSVRLAGNRYWTEALALHVGKKLTLRFDPDALHAEVQVYTLSNVFVCTAPCIAAVGFADTNAAREHARARKQFMRSAKEQRSAEVRMSAAQVAAQVPSPPPESLPPAGVIAPIFGTHRSPRPRPQAEPLQRTGTDDGREAALGDLLERIQARQNALSGWEPRDDI